MTAALKREFNAACDEIDSFFVILKKLDEETLSLSPMMPTMQNGIEESQRKMWLKTLKGSAFLLLYNLVESTVRNAVLHIYLRLVSENVEFDQCIPQIKRIILKNLHNHNIDKIEPKLTNLACHIISETYEDRKLVPGGSIDARTIRELASRYGFSEPKTRGDSLREVKAHRNDLAHGITRFSDVGRSSTGLELLTKKDHIVESLKELIKEIDNYLTQKKYLSV